jgi:threonine dehydrogenase-like Zn-dependent dehydrogenase
MRAVVLKDGRLEVRQTGDPVPQEGELLLRTVSTAICASDIHYMDHPDPHDTSGMFVWDPEQDVVMGHEFVGEVVSYGPGCSKQFPIGTRVTSMPVLLRKSGRLVIGQHPEAPGSFGELFLVSEALARFVPRDVDPDAVALVDAFAVGEGYVAMSGIAPGQLPAVIGAGAIGLSTVAALAVRGIRPVILADFNEDRCSLAEKFGTVRGVNPAAMEPFEVWRQVAGEHQIASPAVIYECVGVPGLLQKVVDTCPPGSRIFAAGGWYTDDAVSIKAATIKGVSIQFGGAPSAEAWYGTLEAVISGRLDPRPSIGKKVGLDAVPEAINLARTAQGPPRIVVHPNE